MILVTGGAGFIGSHLVRRLVADGESARVLDALVPQVHGANARPDLPPDVDFRLARVTDYDACRSALHGCDTVIHLAAEVGVGQSMYEIWRYVEANCLGTATLLQAIIDAPKRPKRLVVASSMSIYGECGPVPVAEDRPLQPTSVYAVTKRDQEELCLSVGAAYEIPTVALRFFNVYGPGQALSNPYTGVLSIFAARLLNGRPPLVYDDGQQTRDFVHVSDIVQALMLAANGAGDGMAINVGTGEPRTIANVARDLAAALGTSIEPTITGQHREGDIRHCVPDISRAHEVLGYRPLMTWENGLEDLAAYLHGQMPEDGIEAAFAELAGRHLVNPVQS